MNQVATVVPRHVELVSVMGHHLVGPFDLFVEFPYHLLVISIVPLEMINLLLPLPLPADADYCPLVNDVLYRNACLPAWSPKESYVR